MTTAVAVVNLILGVAYCGYGVMTAIEMRRDSRSFGFSHFGAAWICMAFTCGPHHLFHAIHLGLEGRAGGAADLTTVVVGLPVGVIWLLLRVEAFVGGRGDRFVPGDPPWLRAIPAMSLAYLLAIGVATTALLGDLHPMNPTIATNLALVAIYSAISWFIVRTQLVNRPTMGGWSLSGLCLGGVFSSCAVMHAVWAAYAAAGRYHADVHGMFIDTLSVPAGLYFLWVVWRLYHDTLMDWNAGPTQVVAVATRRHGL